MEDEEFLSGPTMSHNVSQGQTSRSNDPILPHPAEGGYKEIAEMMARLPITAIFKRFGYLHYLNILYLQAELALLEQRLNQQAKIDRDSSDTCQKHYFHSFRCLSEGSTDSGTPSSLQWQIILRIREVLKEYGGLSSEIDPYSEPKNIQMRRFLQIVSCRRWHAQARPMFSSCAVIYVPQMTTNTWVSQVLMPIYGILRH